MPKIDRKIFLFVLLCLHALIALPLAFYLNIWKDEASTLFTTGSGFFDAVANAAANERQAPLYFILMSLWRLADDSIFFARLFSVICSLAAIWFFYDAARRFVENEAAARYLTALFAVHPFLVWASVEIRVYALVILLTILLLKFFESGYLNFGGAADEKSVRRARLFYLLTAILALYTNYYLGFMLAGGFVALLVARRFEAARDYFLRMALAGVVFLPMLWAFKRQLETNAGVEIGETPFGEGLLILANQMLLFVFPAHFAFDAAPSPLSIARICFLAAALASLVFFALKNKFRTVSRRTATVGAIVLVVSAFLFSTYFLLGTRYMVTRHFSVLFVPLVLFLGAIALDVLPRKILIIVAVLFALLFPYTGIYKQFPDFAKHGDWRHIAEFIRENEKPGQPIVVFPNFDALSLPYYYKGANAILPDEKFFAWKIQEPTMGEHAFRDEIEFVVSEIPPEAEEIWLATEEVCQNERTRAACRPLEKFVEANYTVVETRDFFQERLRLLRKK